MFPENDKLEDNQINNFDMRSHLEGRGLQLERYPTVSYDEEVCTFPIYTLTKKLIGYQKYRPQASKTRKNDEKYGRYHTHFAPGYAGFWGTESLEYGKSILFLTEGIFKAVRLHRFNLPAVALLGNDPSHLKNHLALTRRKLVAICDFGEAGTKLAKMGHYSFVCPDGLNLDDMSDRQAFEFLKEMHLE